MLANTVLEYTMPDIFSLQIDNVTAEIVLPVVALAFIVLQFFCCWKSNHLFVRLLPSLFTIFGVVFCYIMMTQVAEGWDALGYLVMMLYSAIMLAATLLGWLVWGIYCWSHNRIGRNPAGY